MAEINPLSQSLLSASSNNRKNKTKKTNSKKFGEIFSAKKTETKTENTIEEFDPKELEKIVTDIQDAGKELTNYPSMKNIALYRQKIKHFFKYIIDNSFDIKTKRGSFNIMKQSRKEYTVINIIDEKLSLLAEQIRNEQHSNIKILAGVNEINGLIIDLIR